MGTNGGWINFSNAETNLFGYKYMPFLIQLVIPSFNCISPYATRLRDDEPKKPARGPGVQNLANRKWKMHF